MDTSTTDTAGSLISLVIDPVNELFGIRTLVTGLSIHVSQNLRTANPDPIHTGIDGISNVAEFESRRHIGDQAGLMGEVDELKSVLEGHLEDDTV